MTPEAFAGALASVPAAIAAGSHRTPIAKGMTLLRIIDIAFSRQTTQTKYQANGNEARGVFGFKSFTPENPPGRVQGYAHLRRGESASCGMI
jgi:hypothetical protein